VQPHFIYCIVHDVYRKTTIRVQRDAELHTCSMYFFVIFFSNSAVALKRELSIDESKSVRALVTHNDELFVRLDFTDIGVYDAETLNFKRTLRVPDLGTVADMTSCSHHNCIYIADVTGKNVHRVKSDSNIMKWAVNDAPLGLSVSSQHNVLVTCGLADKIKRFDTCGRLIDEIRLKSDILYPLHPLHSVELNADMFVVCHGFDDDTQRGVCIVNRSGEIRHRYVGHAGSSAADAAAGIKRLATNKPNSYILAADCTNRRVCVLSPSLTYVSDAVSELVELDAVWFDKDASRLYVGCRNNERGNGSFVRVYSITKQ
jgi:hypothetical protein